MKAEKISPAVRKETRNVAIYTGIGVIACWIVFFAAHSLRPDKVPFDYTVFLGSLMGGAVAVGNFFLMGLTVQKVASTEDQNLAAGYMRASYARRMLMQVLWVILAIAAPCFHFVAGIVPLLFPGAGIKAAGIFSALKSGGNHTKV